MFIAIEKVVLILEVSKTTLMVWDKAKILSSTFRTAGGHQRYRYNTIVEFITYEEIQIAEDHIQLNHPKLNSIINRNLGVN